MVLKKRDKYYHFLLWFIFATKNTKGELAKKRTKLISENLLCISYVIYMYLLCYYVLGTVYEISVICRAVHLNSMVNCQTLVILAVFYF